MSAGKFRRSKYQTNDGAIHPIRVQPESEVSTEIGAVDNAEPGGAITNPISVKVSTGKRQFGIIPRTVTFAWTGAKPTGYEGDTVRVVALTPNFWNVALKGATGNYLGQPVQVVSRSPENIR